MPDLQLVARERDALDFAIERIKCFEENPWHGPVTEALGLAAGIHNKTATTSDGQERIYISYASHGPGLLRLAAKENREAFLLTCRVVSSRIAAERTLPPILRDFAAHAVLAPHDNGLGSLAGFIPPDRRGPKHRDKWHVGCFIRQLAFSLHSKFGIMPTQNDERRRSTRRSAMTIIEDASRMAGNESFGRVNRNTVKKWVTTGYIDEMIEGATNELGSWFVEWVEKIPNRFKE